MIKRKVIINVLKWMATIATSIATALATITSRRVLFQPEVERIVVGSAEKDGKVIQKYVNAKTLIKDVVFEETHDNTMNLESEETEQGGGASTGSETGGSSNDDNNDAPPVINPDTDHPSDGD